MLICPQCQFENPNTNKFCQKCGTSLTHKTCHECGTQVPVNAETCHKCGMFTGTVWWAIISKDPDSLVSPIASQSGSLESSEPVVSNATPAEVSQIKVPIGSDSESPQPQTFLGKTQEPSSASSSPIIEENDPEANSFQASAPPPIEESSDNAVSQADTGLGTDQDSSPLLIPPPQETSSPTPAVVYIDPQQRYRLIEPQSIENIAPGVETRYGISVRVVDCQPFQKSLLEALIEQQQGNSGMSELPMSQSSTTPVDAGRVLGIPESAQPYLALQESYRQTLPEIHDAWQQDGEAVVLLEDRSGWKMIGDLWGSEETPTLQILSWLGEMTQLWEALEPWHCRQSLLEITNLRVDEDGVLGLVRLYPEAREQPLTLQDLGHMWQMLSNQSQRTQFTSLGGLFRQMCTNEFGTINEVRSHLEAIAHEQQLSAPEAAPYDDLDEVLDAGTKSFALGDHPAPVSPNDSDDPTVILPMQLLSLDDSGCTDIGQQRDHNEDCFGILTEVKKQENPMGRAVQARGLYILCDGMGGHDHGEVASKMAVETLKSYFQQNWHDQFPTEDSVREAVRLANQAIYDVNQQNVRSGNKRMGTTLVMMLIQNTKAVIAHVGDSRLYCLTRKRGLEQLTMDHSVGQREIMRGVEPEIAYKRLDADQLTQALGPRSEQFINPDVKFLELNEDTLFVLCSDGLSDDDLLDDHWQTHLAPLLSSRANLDQGIFQLIELANEHNGHDNITAVLIRVKVRPNFEQQQLL